MAGVATALNLDAALQTLELQHQREVDDMEALLEGATAAPEEAGCVPPPQAANVAAHSVTPMNRMVCCVIDQRLLFSDFALVSWLLNPC